MLERKKNNMLRVGFMLKRFKVSIVFKILSLIISLTILSGYTIYKIEPDTFQNLFNGIWWAVVTMFTVGYGDYVPKTPLGKSIGILLILIGTGFGSYYMVLFSSQAFKKQISYTKGELAFTDTNHFIIVGWNERVRNVIEQLKTLRPHQQIVLIDSSLTSIPSNDPMFHFVRGNPTKDETLLNANIKYASTILITADENKNELEADMQSILTIIAVKGTNASICCIAEILTNQHIKNAKRVGADEVIEGNKLNSYVMATSMLHPNISPIFLSLANQKGEHNLQLMLAKKKYSSQTFSNCSFSLLETEILLIGIKRGDEIFVKPSSTFIINEGDQFIIIT